MVQIASCELEHLEQVAALLSAHAACALPGAAVAPGSIASCLDRDPDEFLVDPWVATRDTFVALVRDRVVAAGQLWCCDGDDRGAAELRWFCFWPGEREAAGALLDRAIERAGSVSRLFLTGDLPGVLVYGIPDCWPHVEALAQERGFVHDGPTEALLVARLATVPGPCAPPTGCALRIGVSSSGDTVLTANRAGVPLARVELAVEDRAGRLCGPFADDGDVESDVARWLWLEAFEWLRLAGCDRAEAALAKNEPAVEQAVALGLRHASLRRGWTLRL
jgi:hypothetical protein